ncbi:nuclear transport factor 2 family protein [Streptomyces griseus]|uniref:nuclear transport factor 2 family protein n=1 Tax=Streptomyces griseus TaxID=1911 RepID=UPI00055C7A31|nr:nuclear transport factor 2 family protein [Streptomyces griseus]
MTTHTDDLAVHTLVHRFFRALDLRDFSPGWTDGFLTPDARMEAPVGTAEGAAAVRSTEEALLRFSKTQHIATGILTDIDATDTGRATASWNALMTHIHPDNTLFTVGGHFSADLRSTDAGWRFTRMAVHPVWTQGEPPVLPAPEPGRREQ